MPMYDYQCLDCGKESLIVVTLKEHERGEVQCPSCGSKKAQTTVFSIYRPYHEEELTPCIICLPCPRSEPDVFSSVGGAV